MISDIKQIIRSSLMSFKERLKSISENSKVCNIILAVIVVLQIMVVSYYFIFEKEGYHSDEVWSYGLANSFYEPFIYGDTLSQDVSKCHKWVDGSDFLHYLTVQKGEQFRYDSVWYNQSIDMHPPLYFTLLHTISSLFPDTFSKWFGYVINIAAMAVGQVFLYKLGKTASKSKVFGLLLCVMWGFSCGFINLNVFVRMYSLVTMFGILYLYYHCRLYYGEGTVKSNLIKIGIFAFLGALTHHYFLVAAFGIAACYCFYYLFKKQFKMMLAYALTMLGSIGLSIAVFPATIHHLFFMENTETRLATKMPLIHSFRSCVSIVLNAITGISISPYATSWYSYVVVAVVLLAAVCIPLGFLFRKEEWFKKAMGKAGDAWKYVRKNFDFFFLFALMGTAFEMIVVSLSVNINVMLLHTDRYLFVVMPWAAFVILRAVWYIVTWIKPIKKFVGPITAVAVCLAIVSSNLLCTKRYLFPSQMMGEGLLEDTCTPNSEYILCLNSEWVTTCFTDKLMHSSRVFPTTNYSYRFNFDEMSKMDLTKDCYIVIDASQLKAADVFDDKNDEGKVTIGNATFDLDEGAFEDRILEQDVIDDFEQKVFPGYKLRFYSSERVMGSIMHTFKLVPEDEYVDVPIIDVEIEEEQKEKAEKN